MENVMAKTPEEVFTPRLGKINDPMYVPRPDLEQALCSALRDTQHVIIHGESGTGKSWLYKHVLAKLGAYVMSGNLANVARFGTIDGELKNLLERMEESRKKGYSEKKSAEATAWVVKAGIEHHGEFVLGSKEPLEACFAYARKQAGSSGVVCLVLENLEMIIKNEGTCLAPPCRFNHGSAR